MSPPRTFRLPPVVSRDLRDYIPALEEIASEARIDPVLLLTDTDDPKCARAMRQLPMAEFIVGYLHCLCAAVGTSMRPLWAALQAEFGDPGDRPRRRRGPGDRELEGETGRKRLTARASAPARPRGMLALPPGAPPPPDEPPPETFQTADGARVTVPPSDCSECGGRGCRTCQGTGETLAPPGERARRRRKSHNNQGRLPLG